MLRVELAGSIVALKSLLLLLKNPSKLRGSPIWVWKEFFFGLLVTFLSRVYGCFFIYIYLKIIRPQINTGLARMVEKQIMLSLLGCDFAKKDGYCLFYFLS